MKINLPTSGVKVLILENIGQGLGVGFVKDKLFLSGIDLFFYPRKNP